MILNLTKHVPTPEQVQDGLVCVSEDMGHIIDECQRFDTLTDVALAVDKASALAELAFNNGATQALVAGASYLIVPLCRELLDRGIIPVSSFTTRVVEETKQEDGTVKLSYLFKHIAFVEIPV